MNKKGFANIDKYRGYDWSELFVYAEDSPSGLVWKSDRLRGNKDKPYVFREAGSQAGSLSEHGYYVICMSFHGMKVLWQAHRVIYEMHYGCIENSTDTVDHMDGNSSNNVVSNLRLLTKAENARNAKMYSNNTSGVVGVYFHPSSGNRFQAMWMDLEGKLRSKSFNIGKYGYDEAFKLACEYRAAMIESLNAQGAGYTERHGT